MMDVDKNCFIYEICFLFLSVSNVRIQVPIAFAKVSDFAIIFNSKKCHLK